MTDIEEYLKTCSDDVRKINSNAPSAAASGTITPTEVLGSRSTVKGPSSGSKYKNVRTTYNGILYHSKKEADTARDLDLRVKSGDLTYWIRQVPFDLPGGVRYIADFLTFERYPTGYVGPDVVQNMWDVCVIEVKAWHKATAKHPVAGFAFTPEAKIKMKLFKEKYSQLTITII